MNLQPPMEFQNSVRTGVDLIRIERIRGAVERRGRAFVEKIWTPEEIRYCTRSDGTWNWSSLAARFAAKEAVAKALGSGLWGRHGLRFCEIEVYRTSAPAEETAAQGRMQYSGPPKLRFRGKTKEYCHRLGLIAADVSLTHEGEYAMAFCILQIDRPQTTGINHETTE
jgi:holo-[acyl-carrier protein] synthase